MEVNIGAHRAVTTSHYFAMPFEPGEAKARLRAAALAARVATVWPGLQRTKCLLGVQAAAKRSLAGKRSIVGGDWGWREHKRALTPRR